MKRIKTTGSYEAPAIHEERIAVERGFTLSGSTFEKWENGGEF